MLRHCKVAVTLRGASMFQRLLVVSLWCFVFVPAGLSEAQVCPDIPTPGDRTATLSIETADTTCTIVDGGYAKLQYYYLNLHITASSTGSCDVQHFFVTCYSGGIEYRYLGASSLYLNDYYMGAVEPTASVTSYDTTGPTNSTGPVGWWPYTAGPYLYTSVTNTDTTDCN